MNISPLKNCLYINNASFLTFKSRNINYLNPQDSIVLKDTNNDEYKRYLKAYKAFRKNPNLNVIEANILRKICSNPNASKKLQNISSKPKYIYTLKGLLDDKRIRPLIDEDKFPISSAISYSMLNYIDCEKFSTLLDFPQFYEYLSNLKPDNEVFDNEILNLINLKGTEFNLLAKILSYTDKVDEDTIKKLYTDTKAEAIFSKYDADMFSISHTKEINKSLDTIFNYFLKECEKRNIPSKKIQNIKQSFKIMEFLEDDKIKNYLISKFIIMSEDKDIDLEANLEEISCLLNAINSFRGNYSTYKKTPFENSYITNFRRFLQKQNINLDESFEEILDKLNEKQVSPRVLKNDFEKEARLYMTKEYLKAYPDSPISDYLYSLYLRNCYYQGEINLDILKKCYDISEKYQTRIILSTPDFEKEDFNNDTYEILSFIDKEYANWKKASNGQADFPHVIDFLSAKQEYYNRKSANGMGKTMAFTEYNRLDSISYKAMVMRFVSLSTRHEMTHLNDKSNLDNFHSIVFPLLKRTSKKELQKAGIPDYHINYAFSNPKELVAVASEGKMSKYSPAFKRILNEYGMPSWIYNLEDKE